MNAGRTKLFATVALLGLLAGMPVARQGPAQDYLILVVSEGADKVAVVRFDGEKARVTQEFETGAMPSDVDGPHGIAFSPDRQFYYVSLGHGRPFGSVWKYSAGDHRVLGRVTLGMFPATLDLTPDGSFLYAVNFNLHGDMVPSSVSVVATGTMLEVKRIPTCTMPHGSRINPQGTRHYSACMMDDLLVEIDTETFRVARHLRLTRGQEKGAAGPPQVAKNAHAGRHAGGHGAQPPQPGDDACSPTWAQPSASGASIFVACNKSSEIVEVDAASWRVTRRIPAGAGVYNLALTRDGRLLATNKRDHSLSIFDVQSGRELVRLPALRKVPHGVVVSPDDRFGFFSVEGVGAEPGTVEVVDLKSLQTAARADVPAQAAGIDFFRIAPRR
jgi:DNA-binding beta-propeller fold protein YncE